MAKHQSEMVFPIGAPNDGFAQYFSGKSYLAPLSTAQAGIYNVTFEPGCRNNWHIHHVWPWKCPARIPPTNGANLWQKKPIRHCGNIYEMR